MVITVTDTTNCQGVVIDLMQTIESNAKKRKIEVVWPATGEKAVGEYPRLRSLQVRFPGCSLVVKVILRMLRRFPVKTGIKDVILLMPGSSRTLFIPLRQQVSQGTRIPTSGEWFIDSFQTMHLRVSEGTQRLA
jgi:hypothetical protein